MAVDIVGTAVDLEAWDRVVLVDNLRGVNLVVAVSYDVLASMYCKEIPGNRF